MSVEEQWEGTYKAWMLMRRRRVDGEPVRVCARWAQFENFLADMGDCPRGASLVRTDGGKAYGPSNCRWKVSKRQRDAIGLLTPEEHGHRIKELRAAGLTEHEIADLLRTTRFAVRNALGAI